MRYARFVSLVFLGLLLVVEAGKISFAADTTTIAVASNAQADTATLTTPTTVAVPPAESLRTLDDYFPFVPPKTVEEWDARREAVQRQTLVALGLWPMPTRTPLQPVIYGRVERDDFTVDRVFFESYPGHFVTGSLFRPKDVPTASDTQTPKKRVGILCPHGHWPDGRFYVADEKETRWDITKGAERYEPEGRYPIQSRCVQLARMGCVVFQYDMVGNADSVQIGHRLGIRSEMAKPERWGLFSPQAELRSINEMGLQTYNSIAALDFIQSLPDVDPAKIGVTGCSGGGTQTFILCAIDPRPAVAFPAVMVSTAMQGGCLCENACYLRKNFGNVEFAACFAPKPLGMTAADDWTKEMETKGFPELQQLYELYGAKDHVALFPFTHYPHNYNQTARACMYRWMNQYFELGFEEPILENRYTPLSREELTVWTDANGVHPQPAGDQVGDTYELSLMRWIDADNRQQIASLVPTKPESFAEDMSEYRRVVGGAFCAMVGEIPDITAEELTRLRETSVISIQQTDANTWVLESASLPEKSQLVSGDSWEDSWAKSLAYTYGYNDPLVVKQAKTLLAAATQLRQENPTAQTELRAGPRTTSVAALAWAVDATLHAGDGQTPLFTCSTFETGGFRFAMITTLDDAHMLPGAVKFGDVFGMLSLGVEKNITIIGDDELGNALQTLRP